MSESITLLEMLALQRFLSSQSELISKQLVNFLIEHCCAALANNDDQEVEQFEVSI